MNILQRLLVILFWMISGSYLVAVTVGNHEGYVYVVDGQGIKITGYTGEGVNIEIPGSINGKPVRIRDIAEVRIGSAVKMGHASKNAKPTIIISISKQPKINTNAPSLPFLTIMLPYFSPNSAKFLDYIDFILKRNR